MEKYRGAADPGNENAILLVVSKGLSDFVRNTLATIRRSGASDTICIALPKNALDEVSFAASGLDGIQYVLLEEICEADFAPMMQYQNFNSEYFAKISVARWAAIRFLLKSGFSSVTYTDVDVAWIRNPIPLLKEILRHYDIAIQTEGIESFPPRYCTGFVGFRASEYIFELFDKLEILYRQRVKEEPNAHDQTIFNLYVVKHPNVTSRIFNLSELLFANGLGARHPRKSELTKIVVGESSPMIFHANWTVGLDNKRLLLQKTGNWVISGPDLNNTIATATTAPFNFLVRAGRRLAQRAVRRIKLCI